MFCLMPFFYTNLYVLLINRFMNYYSKILSVICTGLLVLGTTMSVLPVKAEESPLQSSSSMQVRGVGVNWKNTLEFVGIVWGIPFNHLPLCKEQRAGCEEQKKSKDYEQNRRNVTSLFHFLRFIIDFHAASYLFLCYKCHNKRKFFP